MNWRGASRLETRIAGSTSLLNFSSLLTVNFRAFADVQRFFPGSQWAGKTRISLNGLNLMNNRQSVTDSLGSTPLQYQPGYRDPIGRTVELELRKVF